MLTSTMQSTFGEHAPGFRRAAVMARARAAGLTLQEMPTGVGATAFTLTKDPRAGRKGGPWESRFDDLAGPEAFLDQLDRVQRPGSF